MTRKKYVRNLQTMAVRIWKHPSTNILEGGKLGESLRHIRDYAIKVPEAFGSYEAAWNSSAMQWCREYYGWEEKK